jgi:hypothetical protein
MRLRALTRAHAEGVNHRVLGDIDYALDLPLGSTTDVSPRPE